MHNVLDVIDIGLALFQKMELTPPWRKKLHQYHYVIKTLESAHDNEIKCQTNVKLLSLLHPIKLIFSVSPHLKPQHMDTPLIILHLYPQYILNNFPVPSFVDIQLIDLD